MERLAYRGYRTADLPRIITEQVQINDVFFFFMFPQNVGKTLKNWTFLRQAISESAR